MTLSPETPARWFDDAHLPTELGVYYWETCDDYGNPRPGLFLLKEEDRKCPTGIWKAFGPIRGAMQLWPMTPQPQEAATHD